MWPRRRILGKMNASQMRPGMPPVDPRLLEANRLFNLGEYESAAKEYQQIGEDYLRKQIPPAPHMFIMAGNAWMKDSEINEAVLNFHKGFDLLVERKKWGRVKIISEKIFGRLNANGYSIQKSELKTWLDERIPNEVKSLPIWRNNKRIAGQGKNLPSNCPKCGAPIDTEDLEWNDSNANCNYCGCLLN